MSGNDEASVARTVGWRLRLPYEQEVIINDTVGFIRDLPQPLVSAFRATLEEISDSDLIVHVVVRNTRHLKDLALDHFTNRTAVTRIETSIIFDARRRYELPVFAPEQEAAAS